MEKLETLLMVSNTNQGNKQHKHPIFDPSEVDKLKEEIHGLKLGNQKLNIQTIEGEKNIKSLTPPLNSGGEKM